MQTTIQPARRSPHLSRHDRQRLARAEALSRSTPAGVPATAPVMLEARDLNLIERLVRHDRTAVSSALLAVAGIGAGGAIRRAVLARVSEAAGWAQAEGAISPARSHLIARREARPGANRCSSRRLIRGTR